MIRSCKYAPLPSVSNRLKASFSSSSCSASSFCTGQGARTRGLARVRSQRSPGCVNETLHETRMLQLIAVRRYMRGRIHT